MTEGRETDPESPRLTSSCSVLLSALQCLQIHLLQMTVYDPLDCPSERNLALSEILPLQSVEVDRRASEDDGRE